VLVKPAYDDLKGVQTFEPPPPPDYSGLEEKTWDHGRQNFSSQQYRQMTLQPLSLQSPQTQCGQPCQQLSGFPRPYGSAATAAPVSICCWEGICNHPYHQRPARQEQHNCSVRPKSYRLRVEERPRDFTDERARSHLEESSRGRVGERARDIVKRGWGKLCGIRTRDIPRRRTRTSSPAPGSQLGENGQAEEGDRDLPADRGAVIYRDETFSGRGRDGCWIGRYRRRDF
jgi:hypothetical protein